jgi:hypothetical protein
MSEPSNSPTALLSMDDMTTISVSPVAASIPSPVLSDSAPAAPLPSPPPPFILSATHPRYTSIIHTLTRISAECESELRDELRSKKVDAGAVRDLLRFHLDRQMQVATELHQIAQTEGIETNTSDSCSKPTLSVPESILQSHPLIPSSLRGSVWLLLLGCQNKDTTLLDGFDADRITRKPRAPSALRPAGITSPIDIGEEDAEDEAEAMAEGVITAHLRSSIRIDAQRTRHGMHGSPTLVDELEQMLVFYCHSRSVEYKQGLNEILAPILLTMAGAPVNPPAHRDHSPTELSDTPAAAACNSPSSPLTPSPPTPPILSAYSRGSVYNAFYALISKFLPSIFTDRELESLRTLFRLFRLLFIYHLPQLAAHVETEGGIGAEVYATAWVSILQPTALPLNQSTQCTIC